MKTIILQEVLKQSESLRVEVKELRRNQPQSRALLPPRHSPKNSTFKHENSTNNRSDSLKVSPILLDIDLGHEKSDQLVIYPTSDPVELARGFILDHELSNDYLEPLTAYIANTQVNT